MDQIMVRAAELSVAQAEANKAYAITFDEVLCGLKLDKARVLNGPVEEAKSYVADRFYDQARFGWSSVWKNRATEDWARGRVRYYLKRKGMGEVAARKYYGESREGLEDGVIRLPFSVEEAALQVRNIELSASGGREGE